MKCSLLKKFKPHGRPRDFQVRLFSLLLMVIKHSRLATEQRGKPYLIAILGFNSRKHIVKCCKLRVLFK